MRKYGGSRACGMCGNGGAAGLLQGCALWEVPFARADDRIGPPRGLAGAAVSASYPVPGRNVGRAFSPAAWGLRQHKVSGTMQASSPTKHRARPLPGVTGYLWGKAAMHPSVCAFRRSHRPVCGARIARRALKHACALRPLHLLRLAFSAAGGARLRSPLQGKLSNSCPPKSLPCKGRWHRVSDDGGVRRLAAPISFRITANLPGLAALQGSAVRRLHKTAALPLRSSLRRA